jgi:hypothetical protein
MLQMTLQLLGFEVFQVRLQKLDFRPLEDKNPSFIIFIKQTQLSLILFQWKNFHMKCMNALKIRYTICFI